MQKTIEKPSSLNVEMPFQFKRSLTPVDEYAARHKLTRIAINEYQKIGVIQIRKFKGRAFVIDTPMSQNLKTLEDATTPELRTLSKTILNIKDKISSVKNVDIGEAIQDNIAKVETKWKIAAAVSTICLMAALLMSIRAYTTQKYDIDSLGQANASLMTALNNVTLQNQKGIDSQIGLANSKNEIQKLKNQLGDYQLRLSNLQKQLNFANQRLDYFQQRNLNAAKQFDSQKTDLFNRLNGISTTP